MADVIRVESAQFEACKARYRSALQTLQECVEKYNKSLEDLRNDYTGKAFMIMSGKVATMSMNIKRSFEKVTDVLDELTEVEDTFAQNEDKLKGAANSKDEGKKSPDPFNA